MADSKAASPPPRPRAHARAAQDQHPAPAQTPGHIAATDAGLGTNARVARDGRVDIRIVDDQRAGGSGRWLAALLAPAADKPLPPQPLHVPPALGGAEPSLRMNVVIHVVGSRGE